MQTELLLQVVTLAGDVARDFDAVGETDTSDLAKRGVRLLRRGGVNANTHAALLRACLERRSGRLMAHLRAPELHELIDRRHFYWFPRGGGSLLLATYLSSTIIHWRNRGQGTGNWQLATGNVGSCSGLPVPRPPVPLSPVPCPLFLASYVMNSPHAAVGWVRSLLYPFSGRHRKSRRARGRALGNYREASAQYDLGNYEDASKLFKKAYLLREDPSFLFNMAQCERQLHHTAKKR